MDWNFTASHNGHRIRRCPRVAAWVIEIQEPVRPHPMKKVIAPHAWIILQAWDNLNEAWPAFKKLSGLKFSEPK